MIDSYDDFIRGGCPGVSGTVETRLATIIHLQRFGDAVPAALPASGPSRCASRLSEWLPLSQGRKNR